MRKLLKSAAILAAAVAFSLSGCIETKTSTTVNPNGAAKIAIDVYLPNLGGMMGSGGPGASQPSPEETAKKQANDFLAKVAGVDAWSDITIEVEAGKEQRTHVKAVAYAADISKFELGLAPPVKWTVDNAGNGQLSLDPPAGGRRAAPASAPASMPAAEIAKMLEKRREEYNRSKPMMGAMFEKMKIEATYTLPGKITETVIFTKGNDNTVTFTMEGKKMIEAMDKIVEDDAKMIALIKGGDALDNNPGAMFEAMYGKKPPAIAKVTGATKDAFDFKKESEAAKAAQPEMLQKLGIDLKPAPMNFGPPPGAPVGSPPGALR